MFESFLHLYVEALMLSVMIFEGGAFERQLVLDEGIMAGTHEGITILIRRRRETRAFFSLQHVCIQKRCLTASQVENLHQELNLYGTLV